MSTQTEHLHLDLREAADIFNPLSTNANFESLDNIIYEIQTKGGVPTYTTTASANLLKLSQNPTPNVTVFKFVAAGDANTWSYQETVNDIVALDGSKKTVKGGEMYVAWVNAANAMVVIAWPDVVNAQTFDGKEPAEWASKAQLDAVNQTAVNATTTAQAAATVANQALETANQALTGAGAKYTEVWSNPNPETLANGNYQFTTPAPENTKFFIVYHSIQPGSTRHVKGEIIDQKVTLLTGGSFMLTFGWNNTTYSRTIAISDQENRFTAGPGNPTNGYCVPAKIVAVS